LMVWLFARLSCGVIHCLRGLRGGLFVFANIGWGDWGCLCVLEG
jgi:hypothetical protein